VSIDSSIDGGRVTEVLVSTFVSRLYDDPDRLSGGSLRFQKVLKALLEARVNTGEGSIHNGETSTSRPRGPRGERTEV
jgi:hypothetical protein